MSNVLKHKVTRAVCGITLLLSGTSSSNLYADDNSTLCANTFETFLVREFYRLHQPGAPAPIASRELAIVEAKVLSGLTEKEALGTKATPARLDKILKSLKGWGADNKVGFVLTMDGYHAWVFPTEVPVKSRSSRKGFVEVSAGNGKSAIGQINPDRVSTIYVQDIPARDGTRIRGLNFYDLQGDLIFGLYGTEAGKPVNNDIVVGFEKTWDLIEEMPRACTLTTLEGDD
ncbi:hypothetical protein [Kordiimonas pumila]|uniref:Uncharacterized protein n=1 Tax=Kordiimonas pumila TaxID=2161677 RepID=A0ABV7D4L9_9PROT|nr:hypothetical protein [Kordiimonas pumila]